MALDGLARSHRQRRRRLVVGEDRADRFFQRIETARWDEATVDAVLEVVSGRDRGRRLTTTGLAVAIACSSTVVAPE